MRWGNENASFEEIRAAAKIAQADDFVMSFPDGYQTDLGQGGVNVSGGQKQRLCIARAILKNPKILILWIGSNLIIEGNMFLGDLMSFITYIQQIFISLSFISMIFVMSVMSKASMDRVYEVLTEKPDIDDENADESLAVYDGSIEFKNVSFKYGKSAKREVLKDINLSIKSGETIGIIGSTGSA